MVWCPLPREGPHPAGRCHQSILVITLHVSAHVICLKRKISHKGFKSWGSLQYFFSFSETFKLSGWTGRVGSPSTKERQLLWLRSNSSSNRYKCTFAIGVLKRIELWINAIWGQRQVKKMGMWVIWTGEEEGDRGALERELPGLACYQSTILKCFKWYCMVWNGMVWYGMVGMVWYGVLPSSNASTYSIPVSGKVKILMKSQSYGFHVTHPIHVAQRRWLPNSSKLLQ